MNDVQGDFAVSIIDDLHLDLATKRVAELRLALASHGVLCLRIRDKIDKQTFAQYASLFGQIKDPIGRTKSGELFQYSPKRQAIDSGYVPTAEDKEKYDLNFGGLDENRPGLFETFHCDDTFSECPAQFTILHARALPPSGGGPTHFMDMRGAFEMLNDELKQTLLTYQVCYAYDNSIGDQSPFPPRQPAKGEGECLVDVTHPMIRRHPVTDALALFIDLDRATQVAGLAPEPGRQLLKDLQHHAEQNASRCQHDWHDYDILIWDNASVQHKAGGDFKLGEPRRFWRHLVHATNVLGSNG